MRFTANQADLAALLAWSATSSPRRFGSDGPPGVRLSVAEHLDASRLELASRDDEGSHVAELEVADARPGTVIAPGPFLRSIVASLPSGEVTLEADEIRGRIEIRSGRSTYRALCLVSSDWPPEPTGLERLGELEAEQLRRMLASVRHPVDTASPWGELAGIRLEVAEGELRLVGASRSMVEVARTPWRGTGFAVTLSPRRLAGALAGVSGPVTLSTAGSLFGISGGGRAAYLRTFSGKYPPYAALLRPSGEASIIANAAELRAALQRIGIVLPEPDLAVLVTGEGDGLRISALDAHSANQGEEIVNARGITSPVRFAVRARYLTDALGVVGEEARLDLEGRGKPITVRDAQAPDGWLAVVMPMREPSALAQLVNGDAA